MKEYMLAWGARLKAQGKKNWSFNPVPFALCPAPVFIYDEFYN
jgi:hypothetical protein